MIQRKPSSIQLQASSDLAEAVNGLLQKLPEGAPAEIIEAFSAMGVKQYLPPKLFLDIVEQAPVAISITDPDARMLYVNAAFERLTGYRRQDVLGKNESLLSSQSTPEAVYQALWETIKDARVWQGALVNRRCGGDEYLADLSVSPVLDVERKIAYFLGMHRDITEVHQLEQRLKYQKGLTEAALDAAPVVVALMAADGKVLLDNHAYKALLGDFRGEEPASLLMKALAQALGLEYGEVCQTDNGFTNIEVRLDPPGSAPPRWFACSGVRVAELDEAARNYFKRAEVAPGCLLLIANEVTASRHQLNEARLNMIRAGIAEQQMVQTMREAIYGSIYKFQAPLNVIKAALSMPGKNGVENGLHQVLRQALEAGEEAMDSLHAALPSPALEKSSLLNLNEILHEVIRLSTDQLLANGVIVDWRPAPVLPPLTGRANAFRGLFRYLIDNAMQAVNESGQSYREIRLETRVEHGELLIAVMDNGGGIDEARRLKVFEPFFCGWKQALGHAGMGLTMAQEVASGHGGSIEIDRHFLGGCRVFVRLPRSGVGETLS